MGPLPDRPSSDEQTQTIEASETQQQRPGTSEHQKAEMDFVSVEETEKGPCDPHQWEQEYLERVEKENQENLRREKEEENRLQEGEIPVSSEYEDRERNAELDDGTLAMEYEEPSGSQVQKQDRLDDARQREQECTEENFRYFEGQEKDSAYSQVWKYTIYRSIDQTISPTSNK